MSRYTDEAKRNAEGDLIYKKPVPTPGGGSTTQDVNMTTLYQPGDRRTGSVEMLRIEAEFADEGKTIDNPAKPSNADVAKEAIELIEDRGLEPAWRVCGSEGEYP
jgi:hypothetical protein